MDHISTLTERGQAVIPAEIRKKYHLEPNTKLRWIADGLSIRVVPIVDNPVKVARGFFGKTKFTKALLAERARDRGR